MSGFSLKDQQLAKQYALALFQEGQQSDQLTLWLEQLLQLAQLQQTQPDWVPFFTNPAIALEDKLSLIQTTIATEIHPVINRVLVLLTEKHRMALLPLIASAFQSLVNQQNRVVTLKVQSAMPMDEGLTEQLRQRLQDVLGYQKVSLDVEIHPELLGGIVVEWKDCRLDSSLRGQLTQLKRTLLNQ